MTLILVTPPAALYTASQAKAAVPALADATDAQVNAWLLASADYVQLYLGRAVGSQTWDWKPWGADSIPVWPLGWTTTTWPYWLPSTWRAWPAYFELPIRDLISVTSITYVDENEDTQTFSSANYTVSGVGGVGRITLKSGSNWPTLGDVPEPVTIRFVAGYSTVPEAVKQAVLLKANDLFSDTESGGTGEVKSRSIEGLGSETYDVGSSSSSSSGNTETIERLLSFYRVFA
jgi:hypothetical protein